MKKFILMALIVSCAKSFKPIDLKHKDINEELVKAIVNKDENKVRNLIKEGANINFIYNNRSLLALAMDSKEPNLDIIKILMEKGLVPDREGIIKIYDLALDDFNFGLINLMKDKYKLEDGLVDKYKYFLYLCYTSNVEELEKFIENNHIYPKVVRDRSGRNGLTIAILGNKLDIFQMLEKYEANPNFKCQPGVISLNELLNEKEMFNVDSPDSNGMTPMMHAAKDGDLEAFKKLLEKGAIVDNYPFNAANMPLILASSNGHIEIVKLLIEKGVKVNNRTTKGFTALMLASKNGHMEVVKELIKAGSKVDKALELATEKGHIEVVKTLIENINDENKQLSKNRALLMAINHGQVKLAKALIKNSANVNIKDLEGNSVLVIASEKGQLQVVKTLIKFGAKVNGKNEYSRPLIVAAKENHVEVMKELIKSGANVNSKDRNGTTILMDICKVGNEFIFERGSGLKLLMDVSQKINLEVVKTLIDAGVNVNENDYKGNTALMVAVESETVEVIKILIDAGANVDARNLKKDTVLIKALKKLNIEIISTLIDSGIDIYNTNDSISNKLAITYIREEFIKFKKKFERDELVNIAYKLIKRMSNDYIKLFVSLNKDINVSKVEKEELHNYINLLYHLPNLPKELFEKILKNFND